MAKKKPPKKNNSDRNPSSPSSPAPSKSSLPPSKYSAPEFTSAAALLYGNNSSDLAAIDGASPPDTACESANPENPASNLETPISKTLTENQDEIVVPAVSHSGLAPAVSSAQNAPVQNTSVEQAQSSAEIWKGFVKPSQIKLQPKEKSFLLESGEACVTIPNSVVEKNKKAWECFIIGQFYEDSPARGAVHAIANGIWSRQKRDISVSKMEGNAFLFRVPCPNARRRILSQSFWQFDGQTMFVAKWSPGLQQVKPELTMVPVWLELTGVPLQFFNRDALQEIAGLVGHPVCLHPSTENLTDIEVAKVYTVIDPRKPLPQFVNARFENGDIRRIAVSSPWLPSLCSYCKKVGHTITRCKDAPKTCLTCNSVRHSTESCPRGRGIPKKDKGKAPIKSLLPTVQQAKQVYKPVENQKNVSAPSSTVPVTVSADTEAGSTKIARAHMMVVDANHTSGTNIASTSNRHGSGSPTVTVHDLSQGKLFVDLSGSGAFSLASHTPSSSSASSVSERESISDDDDNQDEDQDGYIEVISKRFKRQSIAKAKARVRGPQIL
ncbi:hypothetical protein Bca4012_068109 [Brassica carinata]